MFQNKLITVLIWATKAITPQKRKRPTRSQIIFTNKFQEDKIAARSFYIYGHFFLKAETQKGQDLFIDAATTLLAYELSCSWVLFDVELFHTCWNNSFEFTSSFTRVDDVISGAALMEPRADSRPITSITTYTTAKTPKPTAANLLVRFAHFHTIRTGSVQQ